MLIIPKSILLYNILRIYLRIILLPGSMHERSAASSRYRCGCAA